MILDNNKYINTTQAISADTAYIMNRMMWNVLHSRKGTAYGKAPDGEMDSCGQDRYDEQLQGLHLCRSDAVLCHSHLVGL